MIIKENESFLGFDLSTQKVDNGNWNLDYLNETLNN